MPKVAKSTTAEVKKLRSELEKVLADLKKAQDREQRALADYQNLIRRTREDRGTAARMAAREFVENLLQPLEHLGLAAAQINDAGVNMVVTELWKALQSQGLQEIDALGKTFDVNTMEVVEREGDGEHVVKVVKPGYMLNGEVIQHAKVVVGSANES